MGLQQIIFAGLIIFASYLVSTVTGFGANILGLPVLALVVGLEPGKQSLIALGAILYVYVTLRWWKMVNVRELIWISIVAGVGLILGMMLFAILPTHASIILLALFVIFTGMRGLFNLAPRFKSPHWLSQVLLLLGGVVHGAFTIGGPLLSIYCRQVLPHKSVFRATLAVVWLILGVGLMTGWTVTHTWDPATPRVMLAGLPFLAAGLIVGEFLHHRVDEEGFAKAINLTLIIIGAILLLTSRK